MELALQLIDSRGALSYFPLRNGDVAPNLTMIVPDHEPDHV